MLNSRRLGTSQCGGTGNIRAGGRGGVGAAKHVFWAGPGSCSRALMVADTFIKVSKHSSASPLAEEILVAVWGRMIFFFFLRACLLSMTQ